MGIFKPSSEEEVDPASLYDEIGRLVTEELARQKNLSGQSLELFLRTQGSAWARDSVWNLRHRVDRTEDVTKKVVPVNRYRKPNQALADTGVLDLSINPELLATMPTGEPGNRKEDVHFFLLDRPMNTKDLQDQYLIRSLVPDPYGVMAVIKYLREFALSQIGIGSFWALPDGSVCRFLFTGEGQSLGVSVIYKVAHEMEEWPSGWLYGGIRG